MISKLMESIKSVGIGFLLFFASFPFIFWSECNAVKVYKSIDEGQKVSITVESKTVNSANNGKLIVTNGKADTKEIIQDPKFGLSANALKIVRSVEMFQWEETLKTKKKKDKKTKKKATYKLKWASSSIDSSKFKKASEYHNPPMGIKGTTTFASNAKIGAFRLDRNLLGRLNAGEFKKLTQAEADLLRSPVLKPKKVDGDYLYLGNSSDPKLGDYRIRFKIVKPQDATVLAVQKGSGFATWTAPNGKKLFTLRSGIKDSAQMFELERDDNWMMTMILRFVAFVVMAIGLGLIFKPLSDIADMVPLIGDFLQAGITFFSILIAGFLTFITIAVAWIVVRPLFGIALIVIAVLIIVALVQLSNKKKAAAQSGSYDTNS